MVKLLEFLLGAVAACSLLPVCVLFTEILSASIRRGGAALPPGGERPRLAILMPAHDEAGLIAETLRNIVPQLASSDRLIVVADNCSDDTGAIASREGADVIVRTDATQRGKGFALDFGMRHLESNPPDVVLIIDADCRVAPGCIDRLVRLCGVTGRPVQALYLMHAAKNAGPNMRIAEFAWVVKNWARPEGLRRLGFPCQLMGSGMAFPWLCIKSASLATGHIVEDLKLGLDLARSGAPAVFCPEAVVTSEFPVSRAGVAAQRTRWEHGHLGVILNEAPRLFLRSIASFNADMLALALDLSVPPLALLMFQVLAVWLLGTVFLFLTGSPLPFALMTAAAILLGVTIFLAWARYGRGIVSLGDLAAAVVYASTKIPLYGRFLIARQADWVRSKRDDDESRGG